VQGDTTPVSRQTVIRSGLEFLYFSGAHAALRSLLGGVGAILTLHHVRPAREDAFQPNRLLEVTPEFLEGVIVRLRRSGLDLISLDEMHWRLVKGKEGRRFICLTFDDGYRDNFQYAYPILREHRVPFAIYVPTSFPDGMGDLWWLTLEAAIAATPRVALLMDGRDRRFACATAEEKRRVYEAIYWWLRGLDSETEMRAIVADLARRYGVDPAAPREHLCMSWIEIAKLAHDPLVTIGAHTVNHLMLTKATDLVVQQEMRMSATVIETALGERPRHFSYPVGDPTSAGPREFAIAREVGFKTAVTTRPGVLFPDHRDHLTALPRISLNGEFQRQRYVQVLTSGAATALWNGFRRVDAA
jgi:peptidoglycan/xylan/chitin deacetylase (PgdA/CDA1 family)